MKLIIFKWRGEAFYVIGIEIFCDRSQGLLGLMSQTKYINKIIKKFNMENCSPWIVPIQKADKFSLMQCPKNGIERKQLEWVSYGFV